MAIKAPIEPDKRPEWLEAARCRGLLSHLPESSIRELLEGAHRVSYPKGAVILRWQDASTTLIVLRGVLRSFLADEEGRQVTTRYLRPGDVVGLVSEKSVPGSRGLQVIEACEALEVSQSRINKLSSAEPAIPAAVIEELTTIMSAKLRALYVRAFGTVRQRVVHAILDQAAMTGGLDRGQSVTGTQHDLAISVGSVREVVAAVLQDLKREGLIDVRRGSVVILEPEKLAREAIAGGRYAA